MSDQPHYERRQREISLIKEKILKAACHLAVKNGWPAVSIRKIAKEIEYTPPVIYEHFKKKEEILLELESIGFQILAKSMADAKIKASAPDKQLILMSEAFWDFAFRHTELYQVMYNLEGVQSKPHRPDAIRKSGQELLDILKYLHTFPAERESYFFQWWALSHGFVSIVIAGHHGGISEQLRQYYLDAVARLIQQMT